MVFGFAGGCSWHDGHPSSSRSPRVQIDVKPHNISDKQLKETYVSNLLLPYHSPLLAALLIFSYCGLPASPQKAKTDGRGDKNCLETDDRRDPPPLGWF